MSPCPTPERLDGFVNERLDPNDQAEVARHVDACRACQAVLDCLTADPPTDRVPADPGFDALLVQLKETLPGRAAPPADGERPVVPGYDLIEVVGRGGMGVVFRARQRGVNREVAIKLLGRGAADGEEAARFRREAEALGKLRHPNVVQVFDVGVADGRPYLVMEYVPGGPLSKLADGKPLPAATAATLVEPVARAVHHAHEHGVLHRDLKPGNILLAASGQRVAESQATDWLTADRLEPTASPKVADFGLARAIDPGESLTLTGMVLGTPSYMAPEQVAGDERLTPACDVYGLGAVLYELLTGRPPFSGASPADILYQVRHQDPVPPSRVIPMLPRDLNTICLRCLEKDPKKRYPSAAAVADDLRRWQTGEPILARPVGTMEKVWKWARRRKAAATAVGLALFLLLVGLPTVTVLWLVADDQRRRADEATVKATENFDRADRHLYAAHIAQAGLLYRLDDPAGMRFHLGECIRGPDLPDRRGWEWFHLHGLANAEHRELDPGPAPDDRPRALYAVGFDPTGRRVAAGGGPLAFVQNEGNEPGDLGVWDVGTGDPVPAPPGGDDRAVVALTFDPAGRLFTAAAHTRKPEPGTVRVRDVRTGAPGWQVTVDLPLVSGARGIPPQLSVSPDGARVAVQTIDGVTVLDARTGQEVFRVPGADTVAFRSGGAELVTVVGSPRGPARLMIHDATTGAQREDRPVEPPGTATRLLSPSGRRLARTTSEGAVVVSSTDAAGGAVQVRPPGLVSAMAIDRRDRVLVTAGPDGTVRVWDLGTGRQRRVFFGHTRPVTAVAVSPDGSRVASVGWDRVVKVWDLAGLPGAGNVGASPPPAARRVEDCAFTRDGRELLVVRVPAGELERWDPAADVLRSSTRLDLPDTRRHVLAPGRAAAFSAGGARLAAVTGQRTVVKVWDTARPARPVATLRAAPDHGPDPDPAQPITAAWFVTISPDGNRVAAAVWSNPFPEDRRLRAWDVSGEPRPLLDVALSDHRPTALAFAADGRRLAAAVLPPAHGPADSPGRVRRWDLDAGVEERSFDCGGRVAAIAYDGRGARLAAATANSVMVWDAADGHAIQDVQVREWYAELAFAPDGRRLAGATREVLTMWDPATGDEVLTLRGVPRGPADFPFNPRIAFDATGTRLAASQSDFTVNVWSAPGYGGR